MSYIAPAKVFAHLARLSDWQRGGTPAPVTVEWDLSNRCVLGCQDCHFAHTHVKGPWAAKPRTLPMAFDGTGDLADFDLVRRACREMAASGVRGLIWSGGGEPTTHPQWLDALLVAQDAGLQQGMYTLGGLLTAESAAIAGDILEWVVVSLDCVDGETYAREKNVPASRFAAACDGITHLTGHRAVVGVSFLLHSGNWQQMERMRRLASGLGASYVTFRPTIITSPADPSKALWDRDWVTEALPTLQQFAADPFCEIDPDRFIAYRDWTTHGYDACHGIKLTATITPDGRVWVCPQRRGVAGSQIGDLRRESFADLWARHPKTYAVDQDCRAMCRLHLMNQQLGAVFTPRAHEAFV